MLKTPKVAFRDPALRECTIEMNHLGQPKPRSGNFATVYKVLRPDGSELAVRTFNRRADDRRERYRVVREYLEGRKIHSLVHFDFDEKGIRSAADGKMYPLLTMDWVPGVSLYEWARDRCHEGYQEALTIGADVWLQVVRELAANQIIHGDLQHGNVLVSSEGYFKLVDYDCLAVPSLFGQPNMEIGLEPYQHPGRNADTLLFPGIDNFSALVIYVALRALAAAPHLWIAHVDNTGYDKLLFRKDDFLNPSASPLYHDLMQSPDEQVRDLTHYLFQLVHYDLRDVPPVDEVLLWCNSLEDLLSARDWDMAVQLVQRMGQNEQISPQLTPLVDEAHRRVACRTALEKALERGDELEIQRCYVPQLLDDYPAAAQLVEQARATGKVLQVIQTLHSARELQSWDLFKRTWLENQQLLGTRASAKPYRDEMKRLIAADTVAKLIRDKSSDDHAIIEAWKYLQSLGGHATAQKHLAKVKWCAARHKLTMKLRGMIINAPPTPTVKHDKEFVSSWKKGLYDDEPRFAELRNFYQAAVRRLKTLRTFLELADQCTAESEKRLAALATELPTSYHPKVPPRLKQAIRRVKALQKLKHSLVEPASDLAIVDAYKQLVAVGGQKLTGEDQRQRITLAAKRRPVIDDLRRLSTGLTPAQVDERVLAIWDESLLKDCRDAAAWLPTYQRARQRKVVLDNMSAAIAAVDLAMIAQLSADPSLRGYMMSAAMTQGIEEAHRKHEQQQRNRRQAMVGALLENDRSLFVELFDAAMLRDICRQYAHHQATIARLIENEVLPLSRSGLSPVEAGALEKTGDNEYTARWNWPPARFANECRLVVSRTLPTPGADPSELPAVYSVAISRAQWEVDGECHRIPTVAEWAESHVIVWFSIDMGFQPFACEPLVLGQIDPAKKQRRWGLFG